MGPLRAHSDGALRPFRVVRRWWVGPTGRVREDVLEEVEEIADRLNEIKSKAAEIQTDPINRTIIVKDTFEKIKMMEQLVEILDRDQETRIYNINNMGVDYIR